MSAIGPQIPSHLLGHRQSPSDDENPDIGPQIPSTQEKIRPSADDVKKLAPVAVGPQMPLGLIDNDAEQEDEDGYGPSMPSVSATRYTRKSPIPEPSSSKRRLGPTLPSYAPTYNPQQQMSYSDDDDDDIGPKPLPPGMQHEESDAVKEFVEKEEKRRRQIEDAAKPKALKREEWMLVPPSSSDLLGNLDPTKLKGRQFSRTTAPARGKTDNSLWTETPAERQQRLADEVSGKKRRAVESQPDPEVEKGKKKRKQDEEFIRKGVENYTEKLRGPALIAQHAAIKKPEDDKVNDAIWDHSRDMGLGGRLMDDDKRNKMIKEAKSLGDRFGSGKGGGFL